MKNKILQIAKDQGLNYDEDIVCKFGELLVNTCIDAVTNADTKTMVYTTYDKSIVDGVKHACKKAILKEFDENIQ